MTLPFQTMTSATDSGFFRMKWFLLLSLGFLPAFAFSSDGPWQWQSDLIPDVGFDLDQARVIHVTNLDGDGKGSLRDALWAKGPRLIVFDVGGVIDLKKKGLSLSESDCFVAGQTAPAPGITLIRGGLMLKSDRTVIQHLAVRPGDAGEPKGSGWTPDSISTSGGPEDVWIDHCSCTWSVDENLSASTYKPEDGQPAGRIHFRNCLVAEALHDSSHEKGPHSKGTLVYGGTQEVAIVGCLYSSQVERNPLFQPGTSGVIVNNLICNPGQRAMHGGIPGPGNGDSVNFARIAVVGNIIYYGKDTKRSARAIFEGQADAYFRDNEGYDWFGQPLELLRHPFETLDAPPVWPEGLEAKSHAATVFHAARFAGTRPAQRDSIDQRIIADALSGTAQVIDSQGDVGGYPIYQATQHVLDVPETGRREWLEKLAKEVTLGE